MIKLTKSKIILFLTLVFALAILPNKVFAGTYGQLTFEVKDDDTVRIIDCDKNATNITIPSKIDGYPVNEICTTYNYTQNKSYTAFKECTKLVSVTIPNSVKEIGMDSFYGCTSLKSIVIPSSVKEISYNTFWKCSSLESVTIPNTVTSIQSDAFNGCSSLQSITLPSKLTYLGGGAFEGCTKLKSITVPAGITDLRYGTFKDCKSLATVYLPAGLTGTSNSVFEGCTALTSITLPKKLNQLGAGAFYDCTNLKSVVIGEYIRNIDCDVFRNCTALTSVTIKRNDTISISDDAFRDANSNVVLNVIKGSDAYKWALNHDMKYSFISPSASDFVVSGISNKTYTGKGLTQSPKISYGDLTLTNGKDYTLSYTNNVNVGTATVKIIGKGNYVGTTSRTFKINPKSIAKFSVTGIKNKTYTGKAITQSPTVKDGSTKLKNNSNYTISYKSNKWVGTATIKITAKGNYSGTITKKFKINPKGTSLKKLTKKSKSFKANWKAQKKQTSGYEVQYSTSSKFKSGNKKATIRKNKTTSTTVKNLKKNKKYYVRIRTYKNVKENGKWVKYYSGWSKAMNVKTK